MKPATILLLNRRGAVVGSALIDKDDLEFLNQWQWCLSPNGYAVRFDTQQGRQIYMHRAVMGFKPGDGRLVDHSNRNRLDNQRENLREATPAGNSQNCGARAGSTSRYRGVSWDKRQRCWRAVAQLNRRYIEIGPYDDELEAAQAVSEWRSEHMPFSTEAAA